MIWVFLLLAVVIVAIPAITIYLPYLRSPERHWASEVLKAYSEAQRQVSAETTALQKLGQKERDEKQALTQRAFQQFLSSVSASKLEAYPGIGPATVERLERHGYTDLAKLANTTIRAHGLGDKRLADVTIAVRQLVREAESRFNAGACRQAQELAAEKAQIVRHYEELRMRAEVRYAAASDVVRLLKERAAIARQVTFWQCFRNNRDVVVPPEVLAIPLPDLPAVLRKAEKHARAAFDEPQSRTKSGPGKSAANAPRAVDKAVVPDAASAALTSAQTRAQSSPPAQSHRTRDQQTIATHSADRVPKSPSSGSVAPHAAADDGHDSLEAIIEFVYAIARTDGSLARKEKELIEDIVERLHGKDQVTYNKVRAYCAHYESAPIDVGSSIRRIKERAAPEQRRQLFSLACRIAEAAGTINQRESAFLERVSREWDVPWNGPSGVTSVASAAAPPKGAAQVKLVAPSNAADDPRLTLGIDGSLALTAELVRQRFQLLSARFAPEKVETMGSEFVAMAERKLSAIRAAAERLIEPFGETLESHEEKPEAAELRHNPDLDAMFGA
jgi:uncharacterized tellurite resistance protein B-like protein